jgi:hypothetical protein
VDVHHLKPRAEGGTHEPDNLVVLCGAHHRAVHHGKLVICGQVSTGLEFRRGDGSPHARVAPVSSDQRTKVTAALCSMGFARTDVQRVLLAVQGSNGDTERVLREALRLLTEAS